MNGHYLSVGKGECKYFSYIEEVNEVRVANCVFELTVVTDTEIDRMITRIDHYNELDKYDKNRINFKYNFILNNCAISTHKILLLCGEYRITYRTSKIMPSKLRNRLYKSDIFREIKYEKDSSKNGEAKFASGVGVVTGFFVATITIIAIVLSKYRSNKNRNNSFD